jgi:hypothetical protein
MNELKELKEQLKINNKIIKELQEKAQNLSQLTIKIDQQELKKELRESNTLIKEYQVTIDQILSRVRIHVLETTSKQVELSRGLGLKVKDLEIENQRLRQQNYELHVQLSRFITELRTSLNEEQDPFAQLVIENYSLKQLL